MESDCRAATQDNSEVQAYLMLALRLLLGFLGTHLLPELLLLRQPHLFCLEAPPVLRKGATNHTDIETCVALVIAMPHPTPIAPKL